MPSTFLSACRACGGVHLTPAFSISGDNAWVYCGTQSGEEGCGLLQRATISDTHPLSRPASLSWTEQYRLRAAVSGALEMMTTREGHALDIGCGTGELLAAYPRWIAPVGIDPRLPESGQMDWGTGVKAAFVSEEGQDALSDWAKDGFDIITSIASFEREDDPTSFLHNVKSLLSADGVFVLETPYAALALMRTMTSTFHREAQAVYSLATLEALSAAVGLRIVRGSMTEAAGGSIRLYMTHDHYRGHDYGPWFDVLARMWDEETALSLNGRQAYNAYQTRLQARAMDIGALKAQLLRAHEHAYVIGACPRTFAALQAGDLDYDVISAHVDQVARDGFPEVITEETARQAPPDILIAPAWRRRETLEGWHDQVMAGMRIAFIEPEVLVIDAENYAVELGRALAVTDGPGSVETLRAALSAMRGPGLRVVSEATHG